MGLEGLLFLCPIFRSLYSHTHTPLPSVVTRSLAGYENCTTGGSALAWPPRDLSAVTLRDTQPQPSGLPQNAKILTHSRVFTWSSCTKITGFCSFFCLFTEYWRGSGIQVSTREVLTLGPSGDGAPPQRASPESQLPGSESRHQNCYKLGQRSRSRLW